MVQVVEQPQRDIDRDYDPEVNVEQTHGLLPHLLEMGLQLSCGSRGDIEGIPSFDVPLDIGQPFIVPALAQTVDRVHDVLVGVFAPLLHLLRWYAGEDGQIHPVVELLAGHLHRHLVVLHPQVHAVHEANPEFVFERGHGLGKVHLVELPGNLLFVRGLPFDGEVCLRWDRLGFRRRPVSAMVGLPFVIRSVSWLALAAHSGQEDPQDSVHLLVHGKIEFSGIHHH